MSKRRIKKALQRLLGLPKNRFLLLYVTNKIKQAILKVTKSVKVAYPSTIMIELTNRCNLSCSICPREYNYGKKMDIGVMPVENVYKIIDEVWPYLDSIGLTGMGETFLFENIEIVVDYIKAKNKGIIISLSTNAAVPGFIEKAEKIINKVDTIQVSIDGIGDVYEKIRKGASFNILDNNLRHLSRLARGSKTDIMLNMVVTKENYQQMPGLVKYAKETGIRYMDFTLFNLAAVTDIDTRYYEFYRSSEFLDVISILENTIKNTPEVEVTNRNFNTANGFRKCPFPWTHFYICWNGEVVPCCAKPFPKELSFGNVFNSGLMKILNNEDYRKFRRKWYLNKTPDFCEKCHFIGIEPITSAN